MSSDELFAAGQAIPGGEATPSGAPLGVSPNELEFDEEAVTEEEQAEYSQFVLRAREFISQSAENLVGAMNEKNRPVFQNVGKTALKIAQMVQGSAKAAGVEVSPDVVLHGGAEIVEALMELGNAAGIWPFKQESDEYDQAQAMAYAHGAELAAKETMEGPNYGEIKEEAGDFLAQQVAQENAGGEVDPDFFSGLENQVATGVNRAVNGG